MYFKVVVFAVVKERKHRILIKLNEN